jgi:hypothetical protein
MRRGRIAAIVFLVASTVLACTPAARPALAPETLDDVPAPKDRPIRIAATPTDPLSCTERVAIPQIDNAFDAHWADDSNTIAVTRIVTIPNPRTITGTEEDQRISLVDVAKSSVRELGRGSKPAWSASGVYLAYWRDGDEDMRVIGGGVLAALIPATELDVRWVGDALYFFHDGEIRVWKGGLSWTIANVLPDLAPRYPYDDISFSADAQRFTMTRYFTNGGAEHFLGTTSTGVMEPLGDGNTLYTEWSPVGHTLLVRSINAVTLRADGGKDVSAPLKALAGPVHGWTGDGRLLFGAMSPTLPGPSILDTFAVYGDPLARATLPNLLGVRSFSPDGRYFLGVTRTGLESTQLEVYRCGWITLPQTDARADTVARARAASLDADPRRFVRPVSGAISQYLQGRHTGIDVSAPYGAIIVASDDGVVDEVGWVPVGGRRVCVRHPSGIESCDYHTSVPLVSIGDRVLRGQPVALVGMTGATAGPHVHWEATLDGRFVDPLKQ